MGRIFDNIEQAFREIQRDLTKSPEVLSTRVQSQVGMERTANEAMNYQSTLTPRAFEDYGGALPSHWGSFLGLLQEMGDVFPYYQDELKVQQIAEWLSMELACRTDPFFITEPANEHIHPALNKWSEGNHYSYTYSERIAHLMGVAVKTLRLSPDTRRVFIPIYQPNDLMRASQPTRIPCSLGYHLMIRNVENTFEVEPHLHMTYLMRSCDFDIFFPTDVWLAHQIQCHILSQLSYWDNDDGDGVHPISLGNLTMNIMSFHRFQREGEEIY